MASKPRTPQTHLAGNAFNPTAGNDAKPPEIVVLLGKVAELLQQGRSEAALEAISRSKLKSPWLTNATAVCLLRLGRSEQAVNLLRGLVISAGVITLRPDAPIVFKTNFATALLAHNNLDGCLSVLHEIKDEENPTVQQLRGAIRRFRESLSLWKRLQWRTGAIPNGPVAMDFPLGSLE